MSTENSRIFTLLKTAFLASLAVAIFVCPGEDAMAYGPHANECFDDGFFVALPSDSDDLVFPFNDQQFDFITDGQDNPMDLDNPDLIEQTVEYDPETNSYIISETIGDDNYRPENYMSFDEYMRYQNQQMMSEYWKEKSNSVGGGGSGIGSDLLKGLGLGDIGNKTGDVLNSPFGLGGVDIRPAGAIDMEFGFNKQRIDNPTLPALVRNRRPNFLFNMDINMSVAGTVGDRLNIATDYNTKQTFNGEQKIGLNYVGEEDHIIQKLDAGNTNFILPTLLIPSNQSLIGLKSQLKFGRATLTSIAALQQSSGDVIQITNGQQREKFEILASDYDENRHFFLGHYFQENYDKALANYPSIQTSAYITNVQVWVTNETNYNEQQTTIVALSDLGESDPENMINKNSWFSGAVPVPGGFTDNDANDLFAKLDSNPNAADEETVAQTLGSLGIVLDGEQQIFQGRLLQKGREYELDAELGFISLNRRLRDDEVLAVSYEYSSPLNDQKEFQVGQFANDANPTINQFGANQTPGMVNNESQINTQKKVIFCKMLKPLGPRPSLPIWDLMMKNVYNIGAYQVEKDDFRLDVYYKNPGSGITRYLPETTPEGIRGEILLRLVNLDRLNYQNDPCPDGIFDFVEGLTIIPRNGRLIFPVAEPFGSNLEKKFMEAGASQQEIENFVFNTLYDSTQVAALQRPELDRFWIKGEYGSSVSNEFSLGAFDIPEGTVIVTAGGRVLQENVDYRVDYGIGRVTILDDSYLYSGIPIDIRFEEQSLIGIQNKTLLGHRLDYWVDDDFTLGATFVKLSERPFTRKTNYGDQPISNRMLGFDINYYRDAPWLTRMVDKLPGLSTKEPSSLTFTGEFAAFIPGHPKRALGRDGVIYIDDFEGTRSDITLEFPIIDWNIAATPQNRFPEATSTGLNYNDNRALFNWYIRDDGVLNDSISSFPHQSNHYSRTVNFRELFPQKEVQSFQNILRTFDVAFYPNERGPYNFDTQGMDSNGDLTNPTQRWGGITRDLDITNFENSNIEFIEFWLMDPFIENPNNDGKLYFNLGTISEDVLRDGRRSYENGLPKADQEIPVDTTRWARVPSGNVITPFFGADNEDRVAQDVGFDGVNNDGEREIYDDYMQALVQAEIDGLINAATRQRLEEDPASDDFKHFTDPDFLGGDSWIPDMYKFFNNPEANSQVTIGQNISSSKQQPDFEDLNRDNALEQTESFFEYEIDIEPNMAVGTNFITDKVTGDEVGGVSATWYQFKIPVEEYSSRFGNIQDFRNIRFMRMYMTEFEAPVICRMAEFNLIRNQWRKYQKDLVEAGPDIPDDNGGEAVFNVTAFNIEENAGKDPMPYAIPPGIQREVQQNTTQQLQQNEQSLALQVCGLDDGQAKAVFKRQNLSIDARNFKKLKMFIHAESWVAALEDDFAYELEDDQLFAFIRMGDDFTENYYEYELPLKVSKREDFEGFGYVQVQSDSAGLLRKLWPLENEMEINLEELVAVKRDRNYGGDPNVRFDKPFVKEILDADGEPTRKRITVVGSPTLATVSNIMIGVRNPLAKQSNPNDDGEPKCAEIWFNELRLTDFDESAGVAAVASVDMKLADFGDLTFTYDMHTTGFGTLEQQLEERYRDNLHKGSVVGNFNLDKFLPESTGIKLPMFVGYSESISNPEFDPFDTDVKMKDKLEAVEVLEGKDAAKEAKKEAQERETIKSVNFANVRKVRTNNKKESRIYDIENWNASYFYQKIDRQSPILEYEDTKQHNVQLGYNYTTRPKYVTPFKGLTSTSQYLKWLKEFNFNLVPSSLSFTNDIDRTITAIKLRELKVLGLEPDPDFAVEPSFNKNFLWTRQYGFKYDITKSLNVDFTARNQSRIDEDCKCEDGENQIWKNLSSLGRNVAYSQNTSVNYKLPMDKLPFLAWTQVRTQYNADFNWRHGNLPPRDANQEPIDSLDYRHTIDNAKTFTINGELNFKKLYSKVPALKRLDSGRYGTSKDKKEKQPRGRNEPANPDEPEAEKVKRPKGRKLSLAEGFLLKPLLSLKRASLTYRRTQSSLLPGFEHSNQYIGQNFDANAPGLDYIFGRQIDNQWLDNAAAQGWITNNRNLPGRVMWSDRESIDGKTTLEPWKDFKIDLTMTKEFTQSHSEFFKANQDGDFSHWDQTDIGTYTVSFLSIKTLMERVTRKGDWVSDVFNQMEDNTEVIANRLAATNINSEIDSIFFNPFDTLTFEGFPDGYGPYQQNVLIPAFIAAYSNKNASSVSLNPFKTFPLPNWRINYTGLSKIPQLKALFQSVRLKHGYQSTLSVNNFQTNDDFEGGFETGPDGISTPSREDKFGNYYPVYDIAVVSISEQLSPLFGIDMTWQNGLISEFEWNKGRTLNLNSVGKNILETRNSDIRVAIGYKVAGITLPFKWKGNPITLENDLNFKFDYTIRDNVAVNRQFDNSPEVTTGSRTVTLSPSIDYVVNDRIRTELFYNRTVTDPHTTNAFPAVNSRGGLRITFALAQ